MISTLNLPWRSWRKDIESADVVLALRSNVRNQSKLRHLARTAEFPCTQLRPGTIPHVARALRRLLDMDDPGTPEVADLALFARSGTSDKLEALEETRLAVEQIVIPRDSGGTLTAFSQRPQNAARTCGTLSPKISQFWGRTQPPPADFSSLNSRDLERALCRVRGRTLPIEAEGRKQTGPEFFSCCCLFSTCCFRSRNLLN